MVLILARLYDMVKFLEGVEPSLNAYEYLYGISVLCMLLIIYPSVENVTDDFEICIVIRLYQTLSAQKCIQKVKL